MPIGSVLTGAQLYQLFSRFVTSGQSDTSIDKFTFYNLLNIVKNEIEMEREWNKLKGVDKSQLWNPGDTFNNSPKFLPANWNFWQSEEKIALVSASNSNDYEYIDEVTQQKQLEYQSDSYRFYGDYFNNQFYILGSADKQYQIWQFYLQSSPDFSLADPTWKTADAQFWIFPATAHPILAIYAAAMYKSGLNYDQISAKQAGDNYEIVKRIKNWLSKWDARLQTGALAGINRGVKTYNETHLSGRVNINDSDYDD